MGTRFTFTMSACIAVLLTVALTTGCRNGTLLLGMNDEIKLGRDAADQFETENPVSRDAALNAMVSRIGADIAAAASPPNYPYDFRVIDKNDVNAAAFPGGRIYIYRGLIDVLQRDRDKIAWVLGHEASHVAKRHTAKRIEKQLGIGLLTQVLLGRGDAAQVATAVSGLVFLDYGRSDEFQADREGLIYAHRAGYDPTAAIGVISAFQELHGDRDPGKVEILFMTHPGDNARLRNIQTVLEREGFRGRYYP